MCYMINVCFVIWHVIFPHVCISEYASDIMNTLTICKEQSIYWTRCIFCQEGKDEKLQCPADSKRGNVGAGYQLRQFKELGFMPISVNIDQFDEGNGNEDTLKRNNACWHKRCRCKINTTKLKRMEKRLAQRDQQEVTSAKKFIRLSVSSGSCSAEHCFFFVNRKKVQTILFAKLQHLVWILVSENTQQLCKIKNY